MQIDFANLSKAYREHQKAIDAAIHKVIDTSSFIMGEEIQILEEQLAHYTGASHAIVCSSGTDALLMSMMALQIGAGDEVITTPFSFIATAETISLLGAKPVFVDIESKNYHIDSNLIEEKITSKTAAIVPVSLYGQCADMNSINSIAEAYGLKVIEDAAQSFGATYYDKKSCNLSDLACTSFFPAKPLGCFGDGGAVFTNNNELAEKIKSLRLHGQTQRYYHKYIGIGGRMDTIQAAVLIEKLKNYAKDIERRQQVAEWYNERLIDHVKIPKIRSGNQSVWAQYSIAVKNRNQLKSYLQEKKIPTAIHYPKPLHLQECFEYLRYEEGTYPVAEQISNEILSLPMNPYLSKKEVEYISNHINEFVR